MIVQLYIGFVLLIQEDPVKGLPMSSCLSPRHGSNSLVHTLKEYISGARINSKLGFLMQLYQGADGYDNLNFSLKLAIFNSMYDQVLDIEEIQAYI